MKPLINSLKTYILFNTVFTISIPVYSEYRIWNGKNGFNVDAAIVGYDSESGVITLLKKADVDNGSLLSSKKNIITTSVANVSNEDLIVVEKFHSEIDVYRKNHSDDWYNVFLHSKGVQFTEGVDLPGKKVEKNQVLAAYFLREAARNNYKPAFMPFAELLFYHSPPGSMDRTMADTYYQKLAEGGSREAYYKMGLLNYYEMHPLSVKKAAKNQFLNAISGGKPELLALKHLAILESEVGNVIASIDYYTQYAKFMMEAERLFDEIYMRNEALGAIDAIIKLGDAERAATLKVKFESRFNGENLRSVKKDFVSSGTAWFCAPRHVVTCWHVLESGTKYFILTEKGERIVLELIGKDKLNDIAVLQVNDQNFRAPKFLPICKRTAKTAENVFTIGFPLVDILGNKAKYTEGTISSTTGLSNDLRVLQISVPVQSGNSGGPLINGKGEVVGIVASKLAAARIFEWTGDLPQNVNYAVKVDYLRVVLDSLKVPFVTDSDWPETISNEDMIEEIKTGVIQIIAE